MPEMPVYVATVAKRSSRELLKIDRQEEENAEGFY